MMKFKIDENMPPDIAAELRTMGHDAHHVADQSIQGFTDERLLARMRTEGRILITLDRGIGDIRRFPPADYPGIIVLRCTTSGAGAIRALLLRHLPALLAQPLAGRLCTVTPTGIRIR